MITTGTSANVGLARICSMIFEPAVLRQVQIHDGKIRHRSVAPGRKSAKASAPSSMTVNSAIQVRRGQSAPQQIDVRRIVLNDQEMVLPLDGHCIAHFNSSLAERIATSGSVNRKVAPWPAATQPRSARHTVPRLAGKSPVPRRCREFFCRAAAGTPRKSACGTPARCRCRYRKQRIVVRRLFLAPIRGCAADARCGI